VCCIAAVLRLTIWRPAQAVKKNGKGCRLALLLVGLGKTWPPHGPRCRQKTLFRALKSAGSDERCRGRRESSGQGTAGRPVRKRYKRPRMRREGPLFAAKKGPGLRHKGSCRSSTAVAITGGGKGPASFCSKKKGVGARAGGTACQQNR